jgi:hypothetical protein
VRIPGLALGATLFVLLPAAAAAQPYPWQRLDATGVDTGLIRSMTVRVSVGGAALTATIDEAYFNGATVSLTMSARLSDLNLEVAQAHESMRSIHPHVGVVVFRCRGGARCVTYSAPGDGFFEFPGPTQFGFFVEDGAMAERALADLRRIARGGS